eukprot:TRINITY_DN48994_c0_g1_i1.p1 TRINITY_DN48994_c0_g1~~TRINITY_DN48994_c0_g1_i1.p1  ORF type:complete len:540 (-),score=133.16 TRINITY_DN48994_c0_g1_i1:138-1757(-)
MASKRLVVVSPYPNLKGIYIESDSCSNEGKPVFKKETPNSSDAAWLFFSSKFGKGPCWYFGRSLPQGGSLSSFCSSQDAADAPEASTWPSGDITEIRQEGLPNEKTAASQPTLASICLDCKELQELSKSLHCCSCSKVEDVADALRALSLLKDFAGPSLRRKLAESLVNGDEDATQKLKTVAAAYVAQDPQPLLLCEPPENVDLASGMTALMCDAISLKGVTLRYQWHKDGIALPRAERPRLVLSSPGPRDEGSYVCHVSAEAVPEIVKTQPCNVKLSAEASAQRNAEEAKRLRFESPLRRAHAAQTLGDFAAAVRLLTEGIKACGDNEAVRADALCRRAELHLQLKRWKEAFDDASEAVSIFPSRAQAHAARGAAAEKLEFLAEAASSWETAELLGGIPEAANRAAACQKRLEGFFSQKKAQQGYASHSSSNQEDPEERWRRCGWGQQHQGRRGAAGSGGSSTGGSGNNAGISSTLEKHLEVLRLTLDPHGRPPPQDVVRSAYRKLALQAHPDKPGGSKTAFQELQNAYEAVLGVAGA